MNRTTLGRLSVAWVFCMVWAGCGPGDSPDVRDVSRTDGSMDADDVTVLPDVPGGDVRTCRTNAECDNGVYCDGEERCLGGLCQAAAPACDDRRSCTTDLCDEAMRACSHTPDNSMCGDMNACNGVEMCDPAAPSSNPATGCTPVRPENIIDCDDANNCTVDSCDMRVGCVHSPRDLDGDGHVDRACTVDGTPGGPAGDDCNDGDPTVYPGASEICDDSRDNNCDGRTDFIDTSCSPTNDTCATATRLPGAGSYYGSTRGLMSDYTLGCNPGSNPDAVFEFTLTTPQDVTISASGFTGQGTVALVDNCMPLSEVRCNRPPSGTNPMVRVRSLAAGTYRIIIESTVGEPFRFSVRYDAPTTVPIEDTCPRVEPMPAVDISGGMPATARLPMLEDDYTLGCRPATFPVVPGPDAVYRITLTAVSDVLVTATAVSGQPVISFRNSPCPTAASERRCLPATAGTSTVALRQRSLPAGTYWVIVENTQNVDTVVTAAITSPMARPPEDICPAVEPNPAIELNDRMPHIANLLTLDDDYALSCDPVGPTVIRNDGVFRLTLAAPSDVVITATSPTGTTYMSFRNSPCAAMGSERRCQPSIGTTSTVSQRMLAAGTYWVLVENSVNGAVTVQAMITTPPAPRPPEDTCPAVEPNPAVELNDGMPHTGRLITLEDDYALSCNPVPATTVRRDAVFRLTLTTAADVTLSAMAPLGTTYMSFRGTPCATGAAERRCVLGSLSTSLLQRAVPAGTYWVLVENSSEADVTVRATITTPPTMVVNYTAGPSPAGVTFTNVCGIAGAMSFMPNTDDGWANIMAPFSIPFMIRYYGIATALPYRLTTNGWLQLSTAGSSGSLSGSVPATVEPNFILAPYWTDWITNSNGVCIAVVGTAPNRRFIVQWDGQREFGGTGTAQFQLAINEIVPPLMNNTIDFVYSSWVGVTRAGGAGIENDDGSDGTIVSLPITAPRAVRFTPNR